MKKDRVLILFSGGADSTLLLIWALKLRYDVSTVTITYGQRNLEEIEVADRIRQRVTAGVNTTHYALDLTNFFIHTRSNLLAEGSAQYPGVHQAHVPARNLIFLSVALSLAETYGIDEIWIGCNYSDRENLFPDCYQEWVVKANELARINGSRRITVKAPLLGLHKEDVLALLKIEGIDPSHVFSGYGTGICDNRGESDRPSR